jgi:hypothetical protein
MTPGRAPLAVARLGVELAARLLHGRVDRERYRAEFLAELHDLEPADQLRHAVGVLSRSLALRAALRAAPSCAEEDAMFLSAAPVPFWRCRVLRLHSWVTRSTEDGQRYQACSQCGEDRGPAAAGMMSTPPWPGDR